MKRYILLILLLVAISGCNERKPHTPPIDSVSTLYSITHGSEGLNIHTLNTDGTIADSILLIGKARRIVCMSSSYAAYLSALGCDSTICGIAGTKYISDSAVIKRIDAGQIAEVGSDTYPDYEKILSLHPDIVATYSMPGSDFAPHLKTLGISVLTLNDYLENNPLGRASYIRIFGALTGKETEADSIFNSISERYDSLKNIVSDNIGKDGRNKVLINIPFSDVWYIPGGDSYMSRLVYDAGGEIVGAIPGKTVSGTISIEKAFELSKDADAWLNPGWCNSLNALYGENPLFASFGCTKNVYNNTLRTTPQGGNDFWESGALRPDLILSDLIRILHPDLLPEAELNYYIPVL